jgi:hypothetical protein
MNEYYIIFRRNNNNRLDLYSIDKGKNILSSSSTFLIDYNEESDKWFGYTIDSFINTNREVNPSEVREFIERRKSNDLISITETRYRRRLRIIENMKTPVNTIFDYLINMEDNITLEDAGKKRDLLENNKAVLIIDVDSEDETYRSLCVYYDMEHHDKFGTVSFHTLRMSRKRVSTFYESYKVCNSYVNIVGENDFPRCLFERSKQKIVILYKFSKDLIKVYIDDYKSGFKRSPWKL